MAALREALTPQWCDAVLYGYSRQRKLPTSTSYAHAQEADTLGRLLPRAVRRHAYAFTISVRARNRVLIGIDGDNGPPRSQRIAMCNVFERLVNANGVEGLARLADVAGDPDMKSAFWPTVALTTTTTTTTGTARATTTAFSEGAALVAHACFWIDLAMRDACLAVDSLLNLRHGVMLERASVFHPTTAAMATTDTSDCDADHPVTDMVVLVDALLAWADATHVLDGSEMEWLMRARVAIVLWTASGDKPADRMRQVYETVGCTRVWKQIMDRCVLTEVAFLLAQHVQSALHKLSSNETVCIQDSTRDSDIAFPGVFITVNGKRSASRESTKCTARDRRRACIERAVDGVRRAARTCERCADALQWAATTTLSSRLGSGGGDDDDGWAAGVKDRAAYMRHTARLAVESVGLGAGRSCAAAVAVAAAAARP